MDSFNLGALFRTQQPQTRDSDFSRSTTSSSSIQHATVLDSAALREIVNHLADSSDGPDKPKNASAQLFSSNAVLDSFAHTASRVRRRRLDGHNDPMNDTQSIRSYWVALFTPSVYMPIFYALRLTLMVSLPLAILSRHPNTKDIFPGGVLLPLWSMVASCYTFGEQLAFNIVFIQCAIVVMVWGVLNNAWNLHDHKSAWWCSAFFCTFVASLFGDLRSRRVIVLHTILILQMEHLPGGTTLIYPIKVGRDMLLATGFAFFQCLWPIKSIAKDCDVMMAGGWKHIGKIARTAVTACWSEDPMECVLGLTRLSTQPVQHVTSTVPGKLFFVMYEVWESTLRLELRRERVSVMEMCMPRLHAMTDTARAMVMQRVHQTQVRQKQEASARLQQIATERSSNHDPTNEGSSDGAVHPGEDLQAEQVSHEPYADVRATPALDSPAPPQSPVSNSILVMQDRTPLRKLARTILKPSVDNFLDALDAVLDGLGKHLNPRDTAEKVPFAELREASTLLQSKLNEVHFEVLIKSETPVDPFVYSNIFVFHLSLAVVAERLLEYGELMQNFDRSRYKSQLQRAWEFFFYDYWKGFWEELPKRITLATPRDVRIFKDAIKMACAYTLGAMYTEQMDPENVYYFGMAILMVVGWPTPGDTMEASVYRVTGMVCACSIAYVAIWHTPNLAGELAVALAGVFIALLFRDRPPYAHTAQYCSMLVITALTSAGSKLELLSRIVSNSFTVMSYYAIVVFIFPIDVLRVTYNAQVKALTLVADRFSRLVDVISHPISIDDPAHLAALRSEVQLIHDSRLAMWGALNTVGMWIPKAAADPAPLGNPYPIQAMRDMYSSLRRLGSATDVIGASMKALMRSDAPRHRPDVEHILSAVAPVMQMVDETGRVLFQDFLDALSKPHEWSPSLTTYHFSVFLSLSSALHDACWTAHRRNVKALRANFRNKVMNRTFAAAAASDVIDPRELARARNLSFALQEDNPEDLGESEGDEEVNTHSTSGSTQRGSDFDPVNVATPRSTRMLSRPSTLRSASMLSGYSMSHHEDAPPPPVTNGSIAHTIAESVAIMRSTERRNSRLVSSPAGNTLPGSATDATAQQQQDEAAEQSQIAKEQAEFEKALDPYERQAQEEERRAFIARRSLEHARAEESTLSHDVNMVLTILVGTDMFFAEAERLLKTMYAINEYARSRVPPPKPKKEAE